MNDRVSQFFRRLTLLCLLGLGAIATLTYADIFNPKAATLAAVILALLLFLFDTLADEPSEVSEANSQVSRFMAFKALATQSGQDVTAADAQFDGPSQLAELLETSPQLLDIINASGNQLYLLKLRHYLVRTIKAEYERTGLVNYVAELQQVEAELDQLEINYDPLEVPAQLTKLMDSFDRQKRVQAYCNVIDALPFIPFRGGIKVYLRLRLR